MSAIARRRERNGNIPQNRIGGDGDLILDQSVRRRGSKRAGTRPDRPRRVRGPRSAGWSPRPAARPANKPACSSRRGRRATPRTRRTPSKRRLYPSRMSSASGRAQPETAVAHGGRRCAVGEPGEGDRPLMAARLRAVSLLVDRGAVLAQHCTEDRPRRVRRDVLMQQVVLEIHGGIAPPGVAETAAAGPAHRIDKPPGSGRSSPAAAPGVRAGLRPANNRRSGVAPPCAPECRYRG